MLFCSVISGLALVLSVAFLGADGPRSTFNLLATLLLLGIRGTPLGSLKEEQYLHLCPLLPSDVECWNQQVPGLHVQEAC